ncbi:MAG: hypothetical protein KAS76_02480, partial [Thermoplasmatales archaeon]|nr:hypothetical protein [Thermoplasmatales archaeon]
MNKLKFVALALFGILLFSVSAVAGINQKDNQIQPVENLSISDDFYFVHLTDTHIRHKIFDRNEDTSSRLKTVVETVVSFENKPAFIVITGD